MTGMTSTKKCLGNKYGLKNEENQFLFESILYSELHNRDLNVAVLEVIKNSDVKISESNVRFIFEYPTPSLTRHLFLMSVDFSAIDKQKEFIKFNKEFDEMMYENYGMETRANYIMNELKEEL